MNHVDELVAELLTNTGALGVWLLGRMEVANNQLQNQVIASAVKDSSISPPLKVMIEGETYFDFVDRQIFADRVVGTTLVFVFDDRSSLALIKLRVRHAREAIEHALATR